MRQLKPGTPARGTDSGRPIMVLLDLLGRRWALRILWELREGPRTFRELRSDCDAMSPSVLNQRLSDLKSAGIVEGSDEGYRMTRLGRDLLPILGNLHTWSEKWAHETS